jgi:hypothetical protein
MLALLVMKSVMASMEMVSSTAARPSGVGKKPVGIISLTTLFLERTSMPRETSCWVARAHSGEGSYLAGTAWMACALSTSISTADKGSMMQVEGRSIEKTALSVPSRDSTLTSGGSHRTTIRCGARLRTRSHSGIGVDARCVDPSLVMASVAVHVEDLHVAVDHGVVHDVNTISLEDLSRGELRSAVVGISDYVAVTCRSPVGGVL